MDNIFFVNTFPIGEYFLFQDRIPVQKCGIIFMVISIMEDEHLIRNTYRLREVLGVSRISKTYLGTDPAGRKVVVKELNLQNLSDWNDLKFFERECEILKKVSHHRLPVYIEDFQEERDDDIYFYLLYEYREGKSLQQLIDSGKSFDDETVTDILCQILEVITYLHNLSPPVIHRDINPKNIILDESGEVYLVDLGSGKKLYEQKEMQGPATYTGTYGYSPFEQLAGDAGPESDIYSLGMTAVHLLTGEHPSSLPIKDLKPQYRRSQTRNRLERLIDLMIEPDVNKRKITARVLLSYLRDSSAVIVSGAADAKIIYQQAEESSLAVRDRGHRKTLRFSNRRARGGENLPLKLLLDLWLERPWLCILIAAALTGGPAIIPLLILYNHPRAKAWARKAYSKYSDVNIIVGAKMLSVAPQVLPVPRKRISDLLIRENREKGKVNLEVALMMKNGSIEPFYLSGLSGEEAVRVSDFLVENVSP
jgi:serine/threonine protein kinase